MTSYTLKKYALSTSINATTHGMTARDQGQMCYQNSDLSMAGRHLWVPAPHREEQGGKDGRTPAKEVLRMLQ